MTRKTIGFAALILPFALGPAPAARVTPAADVAGVVYLDQNANGDRDAGEPGVPGVVVSDQVQVAVTGRDGGFRLPGSGGLGVVYVSVPDGYRAVGEFWRDVRFAASDAPLGFPLARAPAPAEFTFIHASDTHTSLPSVARLQRLRAAADSVQPAFVIVTGDLVRDALRVGEAEASSYFEIFQQEAAQFKMPVRTAPGNHDTFGIERHLSLVSPKHPLYGRGMYRHFRGPDYYSFSFGGIHFVALNTVDVDDLWYYGHVDSTQVEWLRKDLAAIPADMPVVTFNHIPFFTAVETINGYMDGPPAPSAITVRGKTSFRHSVSNAGEILAVIGSHPYPLALGGHMHTRESLLYAGIATRFHQAAAVIGPSDDGAMARPSGITVYRVRDGRIDDGTFVRFE